MIFLAFVITTLLTPQGPIEVNLMVPWNEPLQECAGELNTKFRHAKKIDLTCKAMSGELVDITITGAYSGI